MNIKNQNTWLTKESISALPLAQKQLCHHLWGICLNTKPEILACIDHLPWSRPGVTKLKTKHFHINYQDYSGQGWGQGRDRDPLEVLTGDLEKGETSAGKQWGGPGVGVGTWGEC